MTATVDLLTIRRGTVTAPAGCGKTHLIAETLVRHDAPKPILILTHTNSGVVALRARLDRFGVPSRSYRVATLDGWAMKLISMFPTRTAVAPEHLKLDSARPNYPNIRRAAAGLVRAGHIDDVIAATYSRLFVDEYQDCSIHQHAIAYFVSRTLPTCVLGDPMQAIFGFAGDLASWEEHVCKHFPIAGDLEIPWRWRNAGTEIFGHWLLHARKELAAGRTVNLRNAPHHVKWVELDGTEDHQRRLRAGLTKAPSEDGGVLIIGDSTNPASQRQFASQTPGAITVESVDLRDFVTFAERFRLKAGNALDQLVEFAQDVMTNVGGADLLKRVATLRAGREHKPATDVEIAALEFDVKRTFASAVDLLVEIGKQGGVRQHRPGVLRACMKAMREADDNEPTSFHEAAVRVREQNRLLGRALPRRAVGSTLLLKGLEAEVAVILDPSKMNAQHLYVAMTRGSKSLVVCSSKPVLAPVV
jgi:hypothetical protein